MHSLVFGGFSAEAVRFRLEDTRAKLLVTSDGQHRRGSAVEVKSAADEAARDLPHLEHVLVVRRTGLDIAWTEGRDVWWHESVGEASEEHEARSFDAEHPLFIIYTSGTTGKPKGLVHTGGGYLTHRLLVPTGRTSTRGPRTSTGAPPISPGSPPTPTRSTDRSATASPR